MKLKYDCPAPSKFTKDEPLWKTATVNFLSVVRECGTYIHQLNDSKRVIPFSNSQTNQYALHKAIMTERVEGLWRQVIESFRGAILADW